MRSALGLLIRPYIIVPVTVLLSFFAWLLPEIPGLRRGYDEPEALTLMGLGILSVWYATIVVTAFLGFKLGEQISVRTATPTEFSENGIYKLFSLLAAVGTIAVYVASYHNGSLSFYLANPLTTSANVVRLALYDDYSAGIVSLRYVAVLSFSFAAFRFLRGFQSTMLDVANFICLLAAAFMAGRILITWSICLITGLMASPFVTFRKTRSRKAVLAFSMLAILLLWTLNYSRNLLYYRAAGNDSFILSGFSEAVAYLGAPMQVSVGVANAWSDDKRDRSLEVNHEQNLTTNSAFDEMLPTMGFSAFLLIAGQSFFFAAIAGWASQQKSIYLYSAYPVTSYVFAELWRMNLFFMGIFICLIGVTLAASALFGLINIKSSRNPKKWLPRNGIRHRQIEL